MDTLKSPRTRRKKTLSLPHSLQNKAGCSCNARWSFSFILTTNELKQSKNNFSYCCLWKHMKLILHPVYLIRGLFTSSTTIKTRARLFCKPHSVMWYQRFESSLSSVEAQMKSPCYTSEYSRSFWHSPDECKKGTAKVWRASSETQSNKKKQIKVIKQIPWLEPALSLRLFSQHEGHTQVCPGRVCLTTNKTLSIAASQE